MALSLGPYLPKRMRDDVGQTAAFSVGQRSGVVMQHVRHTTELEGHRNVEVFTEGWSVLAGRVRPDARDYFLVPFAFREVDGRVGIDATMWFVEGDPTRIMAAAGLRRGVVSIAGTLHARFGRVPSAFRPRKGALAVDRQWTAKWKATRWKKDFQPAFKSKTTVVTK